MKVQDFGSITLLVPGTEQELQWLKDNCNVESWQLLGGALAVEPRMAEAIMDGFTEGRKAFSETMAEFFEFEYCSECHDDERGHTEMVDALGNPFYRCNADAVCRLADCGEHSLR